MTNNTKWLVLALLSGGAAVAASAHTWGFGSASHRDSAPASAAGSARRNPRLAKRVDDPKTSEFHEWLAEVDATRLKEDEVLDLLDGNLSSAQKNALLDAHLREIAKTGVLPAPERWKERLSEDVLRTELDLDLGQKAGRILRYVSKASELAELEAEYRRRGPTLPAGNKLAIVSASRNPEFVSSVMHDAAEPLEVREAAVQNAADSGDVRALQQLAAPDSGAEPTLKVASVGALAETAQDSQELKKAIELAKDEPEPDTFGRSALGVAQTRVSESSVDGKSGVLLAEWKAALARLHEPTPPQTLLVQALVTGKAFARALWTETNPETAAHLIDTELTPIVAAALSEPSSAEHTAVLQAVAEFASDFCQECALRAPAACAQAGDRRPQYVPELTSLVRPRLEGTELAFYAQNLGH